MARLCATFCLAAASCGGALELIGQGEDKDLTAREVEAERTAGVLVVAIDGVGRDVLYDQLRRGRLPGLEALLGGRRGRSFPHALFADDAVTTFPSATAVAWATAFTGVPPAEHGVTGNEMFLRPSGRFYAPVPMSVEDQAHVTETFTEQLFHRLVRVPTVYDRIHGDAPDDTVWVVLQQVQQGADRLILADTSAIFEGSAVWLLKALGADTDREAFAEIDDSAIDNLGEELDEYGAAPDVLTLYVAGADLYTHVADGEDPAAAQRGYLREVIDPEIAKLAPRLRRLRSWYVVVVADHGHTAVREDDAHALEREGEDEPPEVLRRAGFRVRPGELEVEEEEPFDAVMAYQGGAAYAYLADRSRCDARGRCDWRAPPRYRQDVLPAAEAFLRANRDGTGVPAMKGTLDMVLVREPRPFAEDDAPFVVYLGAGKIVSVAAHLAAHPEKDGPRFAKRLHDLAVGRHGERAGDVMLVARYGEAGDPASRHYFSRPYVSTHGSAAAADSRIPFILARAGHSQASLRALWADAVGSSPTIASLAPLMRALRRKARTERSALEVASDL